MFARRRAAVRNSSQPLAAVRKTVRNRSPPFDSCEVLLAVPMGSAAKVVTFEGFKGCATSLRAAGVALCDVATYFIT